MQDGSTAALGTDTPAWARPYRSARTRAVIATIALSLVLASIVGFIAIVQNYDTAVSLFGDEKTLEFWLTLLDFVPLFGVAVTFLLWFARAYRNLPALGAHELKYSPRSAVGWWFVPFASMVVPLLVAIELLRASDPSIMPNSRSERGRAPFPKLVVTWWVAFMAATIVAAIPTTSLGEVVWFTVLAGLEILGGGLAIAVIWTIQLRQDAGQQLREDTSQPVSPRKRASRFGLILGLTGAGGCLGLIALLVLLAVVFLRGALEKCPPKDFPVYPGAQQTDFNYVTRGAASSCSVGWESDAPPTEVSSFYEASLAAGTWELVTKDPDGLWYFQRRTDGSTIGRIGFSASGTKTRIVAEILTGQSPTPSASP